MMRKDYAKEYNQREHVKAMKKAYKSTPRGKYQKQMERAKARGVEWLFTFETWMEWWGADFERRGRGPNDLVMARKGDVGPYSPDNCVKQAHYDNFAEGRDRLWN